MRAPVTASISRMPGPPAGPSYRMTTTSPASIPPWVSAVDRVSFSSSKTLAVPSKTLVVQAGALDHGHPGARVAAQDGSAHRVLVDRVIQCVDDLAIWVRWWRCPPGSPAIVRPVTVSAWPCRSPASSSALITTADPPDTGRCPFDDIATERAWTSARCGVASPDAVLKSSRVPAQRRPRGRWPAGEEQRWWNRPAAMSDGKSRSRRLPSSGSGGR